MTQEFVKTYRFRLQPTQEQTTLLRQFAGACRFVYNHAVAELHLDAAPERVVYNSLSKWLTTLKREPDLSWLSEAPSQPLQCALQDLAQACRKVSTERRRECKAHLRFRSRSDGLGSIRFPQNVRLEEAWGTSKLRSYIVLPKLGTVEYRRSRSIPKTAKIAQATVREECGKWYVSMAWIRYFATYRRR